MKTTELLAPSDVADLAGVSRAAVSNWRRRGLGFPAQVAGSDAQPLFSRDAVITWLKTRGVDVSEHDAMFALWSALNGARDSLEIQHAVALLLKIAVGGADRASEERGAISAPPKVIQSFEQAIESIEPSLRAATIDRVLERASRIAGRSGGEHGFVGSPVSQLLANAAISRRPQSVYDPACGVAEVLIGVADVLGAGLTLTGYDINREAVETAEARAQLRGYAMQFGTADVIGEDPSPSLRADVVVCEPPFGVRISDTQRLMLDPRLAFGMPAMSSGELVWAQIVIAHLEEDGVGYLVTSPSALLRGGADEKVRVELVRRGCIEAVVGLPSKMLPHTSIPLALWVLRRPGAVLESIRFLDASESESPEDEIASWLTEPLASLAVPHAEVLVADLLAAGANLSPAHWVVVAAPDVSSLSSDLVAARDHMESAINLASTAVGQVQEPVGAPEARIFTVSDLVAMDVVDVVAGLSKEALEKRGIYGPVVTATDVRARDLGRAGAPGGEDQHTTMVGDVLATTTHKVAAIVDVGGGRVPGSGVYRLRVKDSTTLSPEYLALALAGDWNNKYQSGATIQRAPIKALEVPLVPMPVQKEIVRVAEAAEKVLNAGRTMQESAAQFTDSLMNAVRYRTEEQAPGSRRVEGTIK